MEAEPERSARATAETARRNIETVVKLEEMAMRSRSRGERVSDAFTRVMGSMGFAVAHLVLFLVWFGVNLGWTPLKPFDPFPFGILTLIVSAEGVMLAIFVLISQNRMSRQANERAHLNLQIDLLAEQETTRLLRQVQALLDHFGIQPSDVDPKDRQLSEETHVEALVSEIRKSLPES